ncbi:MAG: hypothetical protein ABIK28_05265, partial [Planctomycetota bacterium]
ETVPAFSEVREKVARDYVARKQQEMAENLTKDLMARYDVKIYAAPESRPEGAPSQPSSPSQEDKTDQASQDNGEEDT